LTRHQLGIYCLARVYTRCHTSTNSLTVDLISTVKVKKTHLTVFHELQHTSAEILATFNLSEALYFETTPLSML